MPQTWLLLPRPPTPAPRTSRPTPSRAVTPQDLAANPVDLRKEALHTLIFLRWRACSVKLLAPPPPPTSPPPPLAAVLFHLPPCDDDAYLCRHRDHHRQRLYIPSQRLPAARLVPSRPAVPAVAQPSPYLYTHTLVQPPVPLPPLRLLRHVQAPAHSSPLAAAAFRCRPFVA